MKTVMANEPRFVGRVIFDANTFMPTEPDLCIRFIFIDIKTNHLVSADWDPVAELWIVPFPGTRTTMSYPPSAMKDKFTVFNRVIYKCEENGSGLMEGDQ